MTQQLPNKSHLSGWLLALVPVLCLAVAQVGADVSQGGSANAAPPADPDDVIATVGGEPIRFSRLTRHLDQGAVPGVSVPGYGTPERRQVLMRLLDDAISNELLHLDALREGLDQSPAFQRDLARFKENVLAGLFRERQAQEAQQVPADVLREQWREGLAITINQDALDPMRDDARSDDEVLATVGDTSITWGDAKPRLLVATRRAALSEGATDAAAERRKVLDQLIDVPVMAQRARESGLDQDPAFLQRLSEFRKGGLAGFRYRQLAAEMSPTAEEIEAYAGEHAETFPELDEAARRNVEAALTARKVVEYLDDLQADQFELRVDEAKLDLLFAQEAERHAAEKSRGGN
jgi:hypothetical protein